jgi:proteasome accessory factor A
VVSSVSPNRATLLLGGETEYALAAARTTGEPFELSEIVRAFMDCACAALPYTSVSIGGRFLRNGGFLLSDHGLHLEWATPECTSPHDVGRYIRAGDRVVELMSKEFVDRTPDVAKAFCSRCNVDYLNQTVWASHENYLHRTSPHALPRQMVPFLASRLILAGAGGWDCLAPGLRFTLSPRSRFITRVTSHDSQDVRPLFHTKNEGLSSTGTNRLHVACSETLCSDLGTFLRFGTTALVLALIDAGVTPGNAVTLRSPLTALRLFANELDHSTSVPLTNGRRATAVEIQRHYLRIAEDRLDAWYMPEWAASVCTAWRRTLNEVETDPQRCNRRLDWAIKRRVYAAFLQRNGIGWQELGALNTGLERCLSAGVGIESMPEKLQTLLRLRPQLLELDVRFGDIGSGGLFNALDRAGVLDHRVDGIDNIDGAMVEPPQGTRATLRGHVVQRLSEAGTRYRAEWTRVTDIDNKLILDLGDPFQNVERWTDYASAGAEIG